MFLCAYILLLSHPSTPRNRVIKQLFTNTHTHSFTKSICTVFFITQKIIVSEHYTLIIFKMMQRCRLRSRLLKTMDNRQRRHHVGTYDNIPGLVLRFYCEREATAVAAITTINQSPAFGGGDGGGTVLLLIVVRKYSLIFLTVIVVDDRLTSFSWPQNIYSSRLSSSCARRQYSIAVL